MLSRIRAAAASAREKGTLQTITTTQSFLATEPPFLVRVLTDRARKPCNNRDPTASAADTPFNPFLPYEPSMFVQQLPPDHVLLLNKYNVVADHTLIVTSRYEEQGLLTPSDFNAARACLDELGGVVFYNSGRVAGASQRHKHLQHVVGGVPFAGAVTKDVPDGAIYTARQLGYVHGLLRMRDGVGGVEAGVGVGVVCMQRYMELLRVVGGAIAEGGGENGRPFSYNFMMTKDWMMLVPRRKECYEGISVNALGFVGWLLVRDEAQMDMVKLVGGMRVLREVGYPAEEDGRMKVSGVVVP